MNKYLVYTLVFVAGVIASNAVVKLPVVGPALDKVRL